MYLGRGRIDRCKISHILAEKHKYINAHTYIETSGTARHSKQKSLSFYETLQYVVVILSESTTFEPLQYR